MTLLETSYSDMDRIRSLYPDVRFIAVSRKLPRTKDGKNPCDEWDTILAPSEKLLRAYKKEEISWIGGYVPMFRDEMSTDEAQGDMWIIAQRAAVRDICLVCYEGAEHGEMCHRFLLLDMICNIAKNNGINIHVRKTGISQTNKFIKSKKQELDLFDF